MMETMSMEYAQYGIRINISPGLFTEHTRENLIQKHAETLEMIPAKEIGEVQTVANVAILASDSNYITVHNLC